MDVTSSGRSFHVRGPTDSRESPGSATVDNLTGGTARRTERSVAGKVVDTASLYPQGVTVAVISLACHVGERGL